MLPDSLGIQTSRTLHRCVLAAALALLNGTAALALEFEVASPTSGQEFDYGAPIPFVIVPDDVASVDSIFIVDGAGHLGSIFVVLDHAPYSEQVLLTPGTIGDVQLHVVGRDIHGVSSSTAVAITVLAPPAVLDLGVTDESLEFVYAGESVTLGVFGRLADDSIVNLTSSASGTTYDTGSGATSVVSVNAEGIVTAAGDGSDTVIIRNGAEELQVSVSVSLSNSPPHLQQVDTLVLAQAGIVTEVPLVASDLDADSLSFDAHGLPSFAALIAQGDGTAVLAIQPGPNDVGSNSWASISVEDGGEPPLADRQSVFIVVGVTAEGCGDGFVDADEECDDGNGQSNDGCSAACESESVNSTTTTTTTSTSTSTTTTLEPVFACPLVPRTGCVDSRKAGFQIRNHVDDVKDQLKWKFVKGGAFSHAELGDPLATSIYRLCVYDETGDVPSIAGSLEITAGTNWQNKDPKGFVYKEKSGAADGVMSVQLKPSDSTGKSKLQLKAKGATINWPVPFDGVQYFAQDSLVAVQLVNSDTPTCWTSAFVAAGTKKNEPGQFKAKAP